MRLLLRTRRSLLVLLLPLVLMGCSEVRLIGAYDPMVDEGIQSIAKEVSGIFVKLDKDIDDGTDWSYKNFRDTYIDIETELKVLKIRVEGLPKYGIISDQLTLLEENIKNLEKHHQTGFVAPGADKNTLKKAISIDESGIKTQISSMLTLQDGLKRK
jgi:hypothetical protein